MMFPSQFLESDKLTDQEEEKLLCFHWVYYSPWGHWNYYYEGFWKRHS